jgi:translation initiation factor IF-2
MNLKAALDKKAEGTIIEAQVDKGLGVVATALIQSGTLRIGDYILAGPSWGRVRRILSDQNEDLKEATPSIPAKVFTFYKH